LQHQELWRELLALSAPRTIRWRWIRGHSGHPIQSRADALAYQAARAAIIQELIAA
jgi:ribonuclease HI